MTLLTEKDAAEKWCPMARGTLYVSGNKDDGVPQHMTHNAGNRVACDVPDLNEKIRIALDVTKITRCIGSNCMAWRVKGKLHDKSCETVVFARKASVPKCTCAPQAIGYCGAFGKVEP